MMVLDILGSSMLILDSFSYLWTDVDILGWLRDLFLGTIMADQEHICDIWVGLELSWISEDELASKTRYVAIIICISVHVYPQGTETKVTLFSRTPPGPGRCATASGD